MSGKVIRRGTRRLDVNRAQKAMDSFTGRVDAGGPFCFRPQSLPLVGATDYEIVWPTIVCKRV